MSREATDLYAQIEARRIELGLSQAQLSMRAFGRNDTSAVQNIKRGSSPSFERLGALADALGWDLYFGPARETGVVEQVAIAGAEYAHVPLHDAMLAAGAGSRNDTEKIIDHLAFRKDWLKRIGVTASAARLARVHGESMQPTMWPDDLILIDTKRNEPPIRTRDCRDHRRSSIYAMIDHGEARVKRIERPATEQMMLLSDNPDYAPELRQGKDLEGIKIIGKVVWWGHTARE